MQYAGGSVIGPDNTAQPDNMTQEDMQAVIDTVPGIIAVVITYIGEEWPPDRIALIMSFYVSGTALGGFTGRVASGIIADHFNWRVSFLAVGAASLAGAAAIAVWLPRGKRKLPTARHEANPGFVYQVQGLLRSRRLIATYAVGFNVLFSMVGVFTWITFYLSAPPFRLSTTALSSLFFVYLIGLVVTPAAGYFITRVGLRAGIAGAILCSIAGVLLTLEHSLFLVIAGLSLLSSGVFIAQTSSSSHLRVASPSGARVTSAGLYITCYYLGGATAGVLPGAFWAIGGWPACVAFIVAMQIVALLIALIGWRTPKTPELNPWDLATRRNR